MSNTAAEDLLVASAYREIARKYGAFIFMNPSVTKFSAVAMAGKGIETYVKFMDQGPFVTVYGATQKQNQAAQCQICGFTAYRLGNKYDREMYINRAYANQSTVLHELLHFLTHPLFWQNVDGPMTEAVTEYFTRKIIKNSKADDFDLEQRVGHYDDIHTQLQATRDHIQSRAFQRQISKGYQKAPGKDYMKRAYFKGEIDAIVFLKANFGEIKEAMSNAT